jgi:hypothetical protein
MGWNVGTGIETHLHLFQSFEKALPGKDETEKWFNKTDKYFEEVTSCSRGLLKLRDLGRILHSGVVSRLSSSLHRCQIKNILEFKTRWVFLSMIYDFSLVYLV